MGSINSNGQGWNEDPEWVRYTTRFESVIQAVSAKFTTDLSLRQDCEQEARISLLFVWPHTIKGFERYVAGEMTDQEWNGNLERYCRNVIRNSILSFLDSVKTGNWYIGRTRLVTDKKTGQKRKVHHPPRYSSLDELMVESGLQIDEDMNISWVNLNNEPKYQPLIEDRGTIDE